MEVNCMHTCQGHCNALKVAEDIESAAIDGYAKYLEGCNYPDVRVILQDMISRHEKTLQYLRERKSELTEKLNILENINESFD